MDEVTPVCDCIQKVNKLLAEHKTAIDTVSVLSDGKFKQRLCIPTRSTDTARRKKPPMRVFSTFCPMCGASQDSANGDQK
jgi:hypothetical protein